MADLWQYGESIDRAAKGLDLSGFAVTGRDGSLGVVDRATNDVRTSYLVVHTGDWLARRRVLLPAGVVERLDVAAREVVVDRTRDEVAGAPAFDQDREGELEFQDALTGYYRGLYSTGL